MSAAVLAIDTSYSRAVEGLEWLKFFAAPAEPAAPSTHQHLLATGCRSLSVVERHYGYRPEATALWCKILRRCGQDEAAAGVERLHARRGAQVYDMAAERQRRAGGAS